MNCEFCGNSASEFTYKSSDDGFKRACKDCSKWKGTKPPVATDGPTPKNLTEWK